MLVPRRTAPGSAADRRASGRQARGQVRRRDHVELPTAAARPDPVAVIEASDVGRSRILVPVRHGRMAASAFAFYRGSAAIMAGDLALTPSSPIRVQLCGDCHVANFGLYGTPERNLLFDLNDFDESAPGPFEWDVKRLAASAAMAARDNAHRASEARAAAREAARGYREGIRGLAEEGPLANWYRRLTADALVQGSGEFGARTRRLVERMVAKARTKTSSETAPKLTRVVDGVLRFDQPPEIAEQVQESAEFVRACLESYRRSLEPQVRGLYDRYDVLDLAVRVVGVGSVGLGAFVTLLEADGEVVILQLKQARASVLEPYCGRVAQRNAGQRVVVGQRTMQAASDLFLGWLRTPSGDDYYVRQLHDMKGSAPIEKIDAAGLGAYAWVCGAVLARAHARSGDVQAIAGYLGNRPIFDDAIAAFAVAYADVAERDFEAFTAAIAAGRMEATTVDPTRPAAP
jgi:uncharacterized protein (DUF2252 family)